jgi:hypothetical protein
MELKSTKSSSHKIVYLNVNRTMMELKLRSNVLLGIDKLCDYSGEIEPVFWRKVSHPYLL